MGSVVSHADALSRADMHTHVAGSRIDLQLVHYRVSEVGDISSALPVHGGLSALGQGRGPQEPPMQIWVDADACPAVIKDILCRAAERWKISMTLVANKLLRAPPSPYIKALQVPRGIDVADSHIVKEVAPGDLVITADIPLAADVIAKGGRALNPRGELYSPENIQERLALRNYLDELRGTGERTGGPAALDNTDRKRFADQLDRLLSKMPR